MDMENKAKVNGCHFEQIVDDFVKEICEPNGFRVCVVGSLALRKAGGLDIEPHDIDLEMVGDATKILSALATASNNNYFKLNVDYEKRAEGKMKRIGERVGWSSKPYIFTYKGMSFNVWLVDTFTHPTIEYKFNLHYAKPFSVLKKKFAYGRKKDVMFGFDLIKQIQGLMENGLRD